MRVLAAAVLLLAFCALQTEGRNVSVQSLTENATHPKKHKHAHKHAHHPHSHHSHPSKAAPKPSEPAATPAPEAAVKAPAPAEKKHEHHSASLPVDGGKADQQQTQHKGAVPAAKKQHEKPPEHRAEPHKQHQQKKKQASAWEGISGWIGREVQWLVGGERKTDGSEETQDIFVIWGSDPEHAKHARPYTSLRASRAHIRVMRPGEHPAHHKANATAAARKSPAQVHPWWQVEAGKVWGKTAGKVDVYAWTEDPSFPLVMALLVAALLFLCVVYFAFRGWLKEGAYSEEEASALLDSRRDGIFLRRSGQTSSAHGSARQHLLAARGVLANDSERESATSHNSPRLSDSTGRRMPHLREWAVKNLDNQQHHQQQQQQQVVQQQEEEAPQEEELDMDEAHYLCVEMVIPPGNELILSVPEPAQGGGGLCGPRPSASGPGEAASLSRYVFDKNGKRIVKVRGSAVSAEGMRLTAAETGQSIARVRNAHAANASEAQQDGQGRSRPATSASESTHANGAASVQSPAGSAAGGVPGRRGSSGKHQPLCVMQLLGADGGPYGEMHLSADGKRLTIYRVYGEQETEEGPDREAVLVFLRNHSNPRDIQVVSAQSRRLVAQVGRFPWVIPRSSPVNALQQYQVRIGPGVDSSLVIAGCLAIDDAARAHDLD